MENPTTQSITFDIIELSMLSDILHQHDPDMTCHANVCFTWDSDLNPTTEEGEYKITLPLAAPADTEDTIYMHNVIMGPIPDGYVVAHIDGNGLNNCRDNLTLIPISTPGDGPYAARPRHIEGWHFEHEC